MVALQIPDPIGAMMLVLCVRGSEEAAVGV